MNFLTKDQFEKQYGRSKLVSDGVVRRFHGDKADQADGIPGQVLENEAVAAIGEIMIASNSTNDTTNEKRDSKMVDQGKTNLNHQAVETGHLPVNNGSLTSLARYSTNVLIWLVRIFALCVVVQIFFAGAALFTDSDYWASHSNFPRFFAFLPILMIILSYFTKLPVSVRLKCFQLFGMIILMFLTAILSSKIGILSALHPVIAVMLFMTSMSIVKQIGSSQRERTDTVVSNNHSQ